MVNVFYQTHLYTIGGVETFLFELARLTQSNNRDLTIIYKTGDIEQIRRLEKHCKVISLADVEKPIKCKKAFFNYGTDAIEYFEAEEYIQLIHANFKDPSMKGYKLITSDKITTYYAVSENNAKSFRELTGKDVSVLYNPIMLEENTSRIMTLVSAQRFSPEKGEARVRELIHKLDGANIPYVYYIFTDSKITFDSPNVVVHKPTLNIRPWLKYADYTVLLSDTEGLSYTAYESLCLGTPLIITKLPVLSELKANPTNSIVLDFDMANLDVLDIYNRAGTFNFKYSPLKTQWLDLLQGESQYVPPEYNYIEAIQRYFDIRENRQVNVGDIYEVTRERASELTDKGFARYITGGK